MNATALRQAASLLLLRDGEAGQGRLQVLMLQRAERDDGDLRSGAVVFPGGVLDAADAETVADGDDDAAWSARLGLARGGRAHALAALRETFEETGLLLGAPAGEASARPGDTAWHAVRGRLLRGEAGFAAVCAALGWRPSLHGLHYLAHWVTPPGVPKRFDTRFFIAAAPRGQQAQADEGEALALMWLTPAEALDPARGLKLLPVTQRLLRDLARHADTAAALTAAAALREVPTVLPRRARDARGPRVLLPEEPAYAEVARLDPDGRGDVQADLQPGRAVRLARGVWRVTAPNAGPMTGPGTNSYLVGGGADWTVIDPGPADAVHTQALLAAVEAAGRADGAGPGRVVRILVTHTHRDHSPGAAPLAALTGAPVWGRRAAHAEGQDASFAPAHQPVHGERVAVAPGVELVAVHTPGHASNHLCWRLDAERMLFTGDQVMQGSTVVINPPDGDMAAYLRSLHALLEEPVDWLAPGHGFLVDRPPVLLRALIGHRLAREARVAAALAAAGPAGADAAALLPQVYADVPPARHALAARSLLAHLLKLADDGRAVCTGGVWRAAA